MFFYPYMLFYSLLSFLVPFFPKITTNSEIDNYNEATDCNATTLDDNKGDVEKNVSLINSSNLTKENFKDLESKEKYHFENIDYFKRTIIAMI